MNCCTQCFTDKEIIGFILTNTTETGVCDFCAQTNVPVIDARELEEQFLQVVSVFKPVADLGIAVQEEKLLRQKLQEIWNIFNLPEIQQQVLLSTILSGSIPADDRLLVEAVELEVLVNPTPDGVIHEQKWESFANEIKNNNRFFLNEVVDLDLLAELLVNFSKTYSAGKIFYRGRVSEKSGIALAEMGKPPAEKSTAGRANPKGIPYLYVSTKVETTLYESRSSLLDYVTIAEFRLMEQLNVISLRGIDLFSPFGFGEQLSKHLANQKYLIRLEQELSRPIRRFDKELDYLPSQYLCEYVKSLGYDAIEYGSSLIKDGINLAVFNDSKLEIRGSEVYEIIDVDFTFQKVI